MNNVHEDGHALIALSRKMGSASEKNPSEAKPDTHKDVKKPPPPSVQRQDTDYDVKPSIQKPKPKPKRATAKQQFHAAAPDTGIVPHATQMGESEGQGNDDALQSRTRLLRSICN